MNIPSRPTRMRWQTKARVRETRLRHFPRASGEKSSGYRATPGFRGRSKLPGSLEQTRASLTGHLAEEAMSDVGLGSQVLPDSSQEAGPWNEALSLLREWDPRWSDAAAKMMTNPWTSGVLPRKFVELVCVALNAACTSLNPEATRRHIRAALAAGATRDEILMVLKMGTVLAIHSCSLGAPMLLEEAQAAGAQPRAKNVATPACDKMRAAGQWNQAWRLDLRLGVVRVGDQAALVGGERRLGAPAHQQRDHLIPEDRAAIQLVALGGGHGRAPDQAASRATRAASASDARWRAMLRVWARRATKASGCKRRWPTPCRMAAIIM